MADGLNATFSLTDALGFMGEFGFFEVVLPLILVFAIFYGILTLTGVLGDKDEATKPLYAVISFVAAFLVIASTDIVQMINSIIPSTAFLLILALLVIMLLGMFGIKLKDFSLTGPDAIGWLGKLAIIILIIIFLGIIDMSLESVEIPVIHEISTKFVGSGDETVATSAGERIADSAGGAEGLSSEQIQYITNIAVVLAFMVGLPLIVIWLIVKGPKKP